MLLMESLLIQHPVPHLHWVCGTPEPMLAEISIQHTKKASLPRDCSHRACSHAHVWALTCVHLQVNTSAKRVAYNGAVRNMVMALAELAHGSQILMDEASFDGIKGQLIQLRSEVAAGPDLDLLQIQCRYGGLSQLLVVCSL